MKDAEDVNMEYIEKGQAKEALGKEFSFLGDTLPAVHKAIDEIPAADVVERPKWMPVEEKLPEEPGTYLIATSGKKAISCTYAPRREKFNGVAGNTCTHWMKMPEGPWEKNGEDKENNVGSRKKERNGEELK